MESSFRYSCASGLGSGEDTLGYNWLSWAAELEVGLSFTSWTWATGRSLLDNGKLPRWSAKLDWIAALDVFEHMNSVLRENDAQIALWMLFQ